MSTRDRVCNAVAILSVDVSFRARLARRADAGAASLTGRQGMIAALRRLEGGQALIETHEPALATMKISGKRSWMALASTHPPLEDRIAALEHLR